METFSALLSLCAGNPSVNGDFPSQRPVTRSFDVFFDLRLNKNDRANKRETRDFGHHGAHYVVTVTSQTLAFNASNVIPVLQDMIRATL